MVFTLTFSKFPSEILPVIDNVRVNLVFALWLLKGGTWLGIAYKNKKKDISSKIIVKNKNFKILFILLLAKNNKFYYNYFEITNIV